MPPEVFGISVVALDICSFPKFRCTLFGGPENEDQSILGSMLGSRQFWETTISSAYRQPSLLAESMRKKHMNLEDQCSSENIDRSHKSESKDVSRKHIKFSTLAQCAKNTVI